MAVSEIFDRIRHLSPERPLRTLWRSAGYKLRPPRPLPYVPEVSWRQNRVLATGHARTAQLCRIECERRPGPVPTIVLGGFVPDATESVYLQRGMLLRHGSVFYVNYPAEGFSTELLFAQLDDLVEELVAIRGVTPVVFSISFGCGVLLEWLRRARRTDSPLMFRGIVMVSPVTCPGDVLESGPPKPTTLLGRALRPFMVEDDASVDDRVVERGRSLLLRMFEAGAQNRAAIRMLLTRGELLHLRHRVMNTLKRVTAVGAIERVRAFSAMEPPTGYFTQAIAPLCEAPTLVLFAQNESSVLTASAPSAMLATHGRLLFPSLQTRTVVAHRGSAVQHASLIFHAFNFMPPISIFYRRLRKHVHLERGRFRLRRWWFPLRAPAAA